MWRSVVYAIELVAGAEYSFDGRRGTWVLSKASQSEIADAREESNMISQIRIYTINKGEMENF